MNLTEVKKMLLLDEQADIEMIQSAMEEKLLAVKKETLTILPVPTLIKKRQANLTAWIDAESSLESTTRVFFTTKNETQLENASGRIEFLELYEKQISVIKLSLMNAGSFKELSVAMNEVLTMQLNYMDGFRKFFSEYTEALPEETKSREMIDTGKLLTALKNGQLDSSVTWEIEKELARITKLAAMN